MAVASLWRSALRESPRLSVVPALCRRVRLAKSTCRRCVDICPDDAISLNPGPTVGSACSECGLCQTACPTEVFRDELRSEPYLLDRARSLLPEEVLPDQKARLRIRCQQAEAPTDAALSVSCLGVLSENILVGAALSGFDEVTLISGKCSDCRLQKGEALLQASMSRSRSLLGGLGLAGVALRREERVRQREVARDRKELFSTIARRVRDHAASARYRPARSAPDQRKREPERGGHVRPSARRETLRQLLARWGPDLDGGLEYNGVLEYDADSPWGVLRIQEESCAACGICAEVCPTGAIREAKGGDEYLLSCNSARCTNCGLCREACPEEAIGFEDHVALADLFVDRLRSVARVELTGCVLCGESMTAAGGTLCPTCEKRDAWGTALLQPGTVREGRGS